MSTRHLTSLPHEAAVATPDLHDEFLAAAPHYDKAASAPITTADASDLTTSVALANAIKTAVNAHVALTTLHSAADSVSVDAATATDLATAQTLLNEAKADWNIHLQKETIHRVADLGRRITSADATDQTTANALANELKRSVNAHAKHGGKTITRSGS